MEGRKKQVDAAKFHDRYLLKNILSIVYPSLLRFKDPLQLQLREFPVCSSSK